MMNEKFKKAYNPNEYEEKNLQRWEASGYANPDVMIREGLTDAEAEPFSMVLPPPNVTGILHVGHAYMLAIEDTIVRYNECVESERSGFQELITQQLQHNRK